MRKSQREGYSQSYSAPVVVDAEGSQLIVAQRVSHIANDAGQLESDLQNVPQELGQCTAVLGISNFCCGGCRNSVGMGLGVLGLQLEGAAPVGGWAGTVRDGLNRRGRTEKRALCPPSGFGGASNPALGCCCGLGPKSYAKRLNW